MEADARRLQAQEEELMRRKQEIRAHLSQLKKERRDLRAALEASTGECSSAPAGTPAPGHVSSSSCRPAKRGQASLAERVKKVEEECKEKEEERVSLELELTEVKENLKKAQSGGVTLGLSIQPRTQSPRTQSPGLQVSPSRLSLALSTVSSWCAEGGGVAILQL